MHLNELQGLNMVATSRLIMIPQPLNGVTGRCGCVCVFVSSQGLFETLRRVTFLVQKPITLGSLCRQADVC